jgi:hypothetical protein
MMAHEPQTTVQSSPLPATTPQDDMRFDRAALLSGRSMYWGYDPRQRAESVFALIGWCLELPDAVLGVAPFGIARTLQGLYAKTGDTIPAEVMRSFEFFGIAGRNVSPWHADDAWLAHKDDLVRLLVGRNEDDGYVWLAPADAAWWLDLTKQSLLSYADVFDQDIEDDNLFPLLTRHRCTVFAPFNGTATWDNLLALVGRLTDADQQAVIRQELEQQNLSRENCDAIRGAYWSWRLLDFSNAQGSIIYTPLLAAWSYWPQSGDWAPQPAPSVTTQPIMTGDETAELVAKVFWTQMETLFSYARRALGLYQVANAFAAVEASPPVFFFASPITPPRHAEEYAVSLREAVAPLIRACLLSSDPLSAQVAWGLLEGHLVTLRSEISNTSNYFPRYLLFPTDASTRKSTLEQDVGFVADQFTYIEFMISLGANDVASAIDLLISHTSLWGGTLDRVAEVTGDAADLLASVGRRQTSVINRRLASLNMVLRRLETFIETAVSDSNVVQRKYSGALDGTDDFMRRQITASIVPNLSVTNLRDAMLGAYPYQYVKEPLQALQITASGLLSSVERSSGTVNTILEQSDRIDREVLASLGRWVGATITLVALLVGMLQVVGNSGTKSSVVAQYIPWLGPVEAATPILLAVFGCLLAITAGTYLFIWLRQFLPKRRHHFILDVRKLRALINAARGLRNAPDQLNKLDDDATQLLARLWDKLHHAQEQIDDDDKGFRRTPGGIRVRQRSVAAWAGRAHQLEHTIELFDLLPTRIYLPRTLCVLRFKSADFYRRTTVASGDFGASLRAIGFAPEEITRLENWLLSPDNQPAIRRWSVATFARELRQRSVTVVSAGREPDWWQGALDGQ